MRQMSTDFTPYICIYAKNIHFFIKYPIYPCKYGSPVILYSGKKEFEVTL